MTLGGLKEGVTPLEMAYAYSTIANSGKRVSGSLASLADGPVGDRRASRRRRRRRRERGRRRKRVFPDDRRRDRAAAARTASWRSGTGKAAHVRRVRRRQDRHDRELRRRLVRRLQRASCTVAVWVGYPDKLQVHEDRVPRRPGRGRHLPGRDLARLHDLGDRDPRPAARGGEGARTTSGPADPTYRRRRRSRPPRRRPTPARRRAAAGPAARPGRRGTRTPTPSRRRRQPTPQQPATDAAGTRPTPTPAATPTPARAAADRRSGGGGTPARRWQHARRASGDAALASRIAAGRGRDT